MDVSEVIKQLKPDIEERKMLKTCWDDLNYQLTIPRVVYYQFIINRLMYECRR